MSDTIKAGLELAPMPPALNARDALAITDEMRARGVKRFAWGGLEVEFWTAPPPEGALFASDPYEPTEAEREERDREAMFAAGGAVPVDLRKLHEERNS